MGEGDNPAGVERGHWFGDRGGPDREHGKRQPDTAARLLYRVIEQEPEAWNAHLVTI